MQRGKFITFEGPEGGGKTTQAKRLVAALEQAGRKVLYTREPGGTPTGEAIREILQHDKSGEAICRETEVLLFAASRAQLVRHVIVPALERGEWVVCDRFADSTTAYQGYGRGFPVEQMIAINDFAIDGAQPDLTILLDLPVSAGFARLQQRGGGKDRIEREAQEFHERVRHGYLELARRWSARFQILDAREPTDVVAAKAWELVQRVSR
ncbi:MAG: dTMP kinase [Verrucomicrobia bacterium]|nr:MAG: dTMP kinase [Verrucomicrobiota bacterium]